MNIYFIWDRQELSGTPLHGLVLHKMLNIDCLCSTCQLSQMTKKERKKYGLLPPKIAESDIVFLGQMCGMTIMALKPNQLQVTTYHPQTNTIIERIHKVVNDMLRSFDLENNHENLEEQEDNPFDYFFQSTAWTPSY
jgi:hypothetical protein